MPSLPHPVKFPGWKMLQTVYLMTFHLCGHITNLLSIQCILIEVLQVWHFHWLFSAWRRGMHGSEWVNRTLNHLYHLSVLDYYLSNVSDCLHLCPKLYFHKTTTGKRWITVIYWLGNTHSIIPMPNLSWWMWSSFDFVCSTSRRHLPVYKKNK